MKRFDVILSVPVEDGEDSPARWDWASLLDTTRPVLVQAQVVADLLPEEIEGA